MRIELLSPSLMRVTGPDVESWREDHKRRAAGYQFTPQFKRGHWDGYVYPGKRWRKDRMELLLERGWLNTLLTERSPDLYASIPPAPNWTWEGLEEEWDKLRDYQREACELIQQKRWCRIALATNAGKGAIIALTAAAAVREELSTLVLCDEISVFQALAGEFEVWAPDVELGLVESGCQRPPNTLVTLAMVPTLANRLDRPDWQEWLDFVTVAMLDEADRSTANRWQAILNWIPNTYYRVGFSGSFKTSDRDPTEEMTLTGTIGPVAITVKNIDLVERGISAKPFVELVPFTPDIPTVSKERWAAMSGPEKRLWVYEQGVVYNGRRHDMVESLLHPTAPNAVVVNRIDHGEALAERLECPFLHGSVSKEEREAVLEAFRRGEFRNLVVTRILDRGTNLLGHAVGLIFASGEGSNKQTLQRVGRGLRRSDGKEFLFLRDILDRGHKYFARASRKRIQLYNAEGFDVTIFQEGETPAHQEGQASYATGT